MRICTMCWIKRQHVLLESKVFDLVMALVYCYMSIVCTEKSLSLITQRRQINKTYISFIDIPFKYKLFNYMYFFFWAKSYVAYTKLWYATWNGNLLWLLCSPTHAYIHLYCKTCYKLGACLLYLVVVSQESPIIKINFLITQISLLE